MSNNFISINNVSYLISQTEVLFEGVSFDLNQSEKVAIVGDNGVGKTTLLKIISEEVLPSSGTILNNATKYFVRQNINNITGSIAEVIGIKNVLDAIKRIVHGDYDEIDYNLIDNNWDIEDRALQELENWGLSGLKLDSNFELLSGGEKEKILLISAFLSNANILIFDEPTNNLDKFSKELFLRKILEISKAILLVSHDRELLNNIDVIYELSKKGVEKFSGNYNLYIAEKQKQKCGIIDKITNLKQQEKKLHQVKIENQTKETNSAKKGKKNLETSKYPPIQVKAMKGLSEINMAKKNKKLDIKLDDTKKDIYDLEQSIREEYIKIPLPEKPFIKDKLVEIKNMSFSFKNKNIFKDFNLFVGGNDRLAIKGENGTGKTTLIKLILGELKPDCGNIYVNASSIYLNQNLKLLDEEKSLLDNIIDYNIGITINDAYRILANFKFWNELAHKKVKVLSGGELLRACLAVILGTQRQPELIILDEPTNNLDIKSVEIIENSLSQYQGGLIIISHDEMFLKNVGINKTVEL